MPLQIVHHPSYDAEFPDDHRFPMSKYRLLMEALETLGMVAHGNLHEPVPADAALLTLAHEADYVEQVVASAVPRAIEKDIGFAVSERVSLRARLATSGTLMAAEIALAEGIACNTAGGSHHARRSQGAGFCTFNDVAVAAMALLERARVERVLVVDLDVHQGDGTAEIFEGDDRVFTFSLHAAHNYPAIKMRSDLDLALPDRTGDDAYLATLREALRGLRDVRPELVFYNAGVDPHVDDRLGRLSLSDAGLRARDRMVLAHFRAQGIPVCGVIGGGYSRDAKAVAERHAILFEEAAKLA